MQKLINWFLMLNKRLYKKASFVIILALIPIAVFSMGIISKQDSGFVHVALAQHDSNDALATQITNELLCENSLVRFTKVKNEKAAMEMVKNGVADEAWIFHSNMSQKLSDFAQPDSTYSPAVTVVCKEKTVLLAITNEKLNSTMYKHYAKTYYINFIRQNLSQLDTLSDEQLSDYFDDYPVNEKLFVFRSPDGTSLTDTPDSNYLTSPVRGLLSILIVLSAIAGAMYYLQDENRGTFSWVPQHKRIYVAFFCIFIATINVTTVSYLSLLFAGMSGAIFKEIAALLLYSLCVSMFCLLLMQMFRSIRILGALLPLICVLMVAVCPVFFDIRSILTLQHLLPPTYYVNISADNIYLLHTVAYTAVLAVICFIIEKVKNILPLRRF